MTNPLLFYMQFFLFGTTAVSALQDSTPLLMTTAGFYGDCAYAPPHHEDRWVSMRPDPSTSSRAHIRSQLPPEPSSGLVGWPPVNMTSPLLFYMQTLQRRAAQCATERSLGARDGSLALPPLPLWWRQYFETGCSTCCWSSAARLAPCTWPCFLWRPAFGEGERLCLAGAGCAASGVGGVLFSILRARNSVVVVAAVSLAN
ncbi:uncharacterized protein LOC142582208 [Dermacentor variabilis]|uniref:uncharacterized protein LOC142582208 n=1 Tax=Dermacentor variabilis TaxID=34621 RepID=UPI003F5B6935